MSKPPIARFVTSITRRKWLLAAVFLVLGAGLTIYLRVPARAKAFLEFALEQIEPLGFWAPILFVLLYVVSCVSMIPASQASVCLRIMT
jgi:uncharacterized membrane protein YdjX (TVP38/TMEM64 family)